MVFNKLIIISLRYDDDDGDQKVPVEFYKHNKSDFKYLRLELAYCSSRGSSPNISVIRLGGSSCSSSIVIALMHL